MIIRSNERQYIADVVREEIEEANRRINERLAQFECPQVEYSGDKLNGVRRFYEDLTDKAWTQSDEECLASLGDQGETEIKQMLREAYRRSRVHPVPNFASLMNALRKGENVTPHDESRPLANQYAVSAIERERLANLLYEEMADTARELASRLNLTEAKTKLLHEQLEIVQGQIISRFTPLV
jgi:hypothetical protein